MATASDKKMMNNFVGGLVSDYHELNTPVGVSVDELNCHLNRKGYREKRKGIALESGYVQNSFNVNEPTECWMQAFDWKSVGNDGQKDFIVIQSGATLSFFDQSAASLSASALPFTVNLDSFLITGASTQANSGVQVSSGKGALFVAGKFISPFYIEYSSASNTITTTSVSFKIRDFSEQDPSLAADTKPATLTAKQKYDLYNQGWHVSGIFAYDSHTAIGGLPNIYNPLDFYFTAEGVYPPKNKPWFSGKRPGDAGLDYFDPSGTYDMAYGGNTLAPLGHYILDPFHKDRSTASGISGLLTEIENSRPNTTAFHAGRCFWGHKNTLYFSQVLEHDLTRAGKCYQDADPTSEDVSDLIATDGGTLLIPAMGEITVLFPMQNVLLVFATNGIWAVTGGTTDDGFSATNFSVTQVSSVSLLGVKTLISVDGSPCFWGEDGIYSVKLGFNRGGGFEMVNLLDKKLQEFYNAIPAIQKVYAGAGYDRHNQTIVWIYDLDSSDTNKYVCRYVLNFDMIVGAFYPYKITDLVTSPIQVVGIVHYRGFASTLTQEQVTTVLAANVTDSISNTYSYVSDLTSTFATSGIKFLTVKGVV
jgi:hypothetical protein